MIIEHRLLYRKFATIHLYGAHEYEKCSHIQNPSEKAF